MRLAPADPLPRYNLSLLLLARGELAEGWALYEARTEIPGHQPRPKLPFPEWRGEAIGSLLVLPEQGYGDQIMFARYVPELVARGIDVTLVCPPALVRLFAPLGARIAVDVPANCHDAWCLIASLPHLAGTMPSGLYLPSSAGGEGVGIAYRGAIHAKLGAARSLPPEIVGRLREAGRSLDPEDTGARDFKDTSDIISGLSEVISVDTATAHLAASMGKPTRVLLPYDADWRWGSGELTIWYPSIRLLRQAAPGDWDSVLAEL
jgi:hypothetical protein